MTRDLSREEKMQIAAEKMRLRKEKEERENKEFYERITSGGQWMFFKAIVVFCTLIALISTIEFFVDGPTKDLTEEDWKVNRDWEYTWHKVLDVEGYMFSPHLRDWSNHVENSLVITYSPIFRTGKKLSYDLQVDENTIRKHEELRERSAFNWFPFLQIFLLIPLVTLIFKRQSPMFNFARIASLAFVFPGTLLIMFTTMM